MPRQQHLRQQQEEHQEESQELQQHQQEEEVGGEEPGPAENTSQDEDGVNLPLDAAARKKEHEESAASLIAPPPSSLPSIREYVLCIPFVRCFPVRNVRDFVVILLLAVAYFGGSVFSFHRREEAMVNGQLIKLTQPTLFIQWSQYFMQNHPALLTFCNFIYAQWYYAMSIGILLLARAVMTKHHWHWWFHRGACATMYAFVMIQVFPCAPPRLYEAEYQNPDPHTWNIADKSPFLNSYAAFPSIHTLWSLMTAAGLLLLARQVGGEGAGRVRRALAWLIRAYAICYAAFIMFIVLSIAHHFVIDVVCGVCIYTVFFHVVGDETMEIK